MPDQPTAFSLWGALVAIAGGIVNSFQIGRIKKRTEAQAIQALREANSQLRADYHELSERQFATTEQQERNHQENRRMLDVIREEIRNIGVDRQEDVRNMRTQLNNLRNDFISHQADVSRDLDTIRKALGDVRRGGGD